MRGRASTWRVTGHSLVRLQDTGFSFSVALLLLTGRYERYIEPSPENRPCDHGSVFVLLSVVDVVCCLVQPLSTLTSHEAPMMSGPSPSPSLREEPSISKKWTCIDCDETFPQSKLLETHAVDTDHKAYRCTKEKACGKLFTLRSSWIRHERSHSAKKSHSCSRCGKRFHRVDHCHGHERTCGRVARRAKGPSQSASTSPATTSSGTTESGTPIDLLTTIVDDEDLSHATGTGHKGLLSFDTSGTSHQEDNGHDDDKATQIAFSGLSVPTKPSPTSSHAGNDWRDYYQLFQSPYDARSPNLQHTEEDWDFIPGRVTSTAISQPTRFRRITGLISRNRSQHSADTHAIPDLYNDSVVHNSCTHLGHRHRTHDGTYGSPPKARYPTSGFAEQASPVTAQESGIDNSIFLPGARVTVRDERPLVFGETAFEHDMNIGTPLRQGHRRRPPSKMAKFFSKLKAVITAPFRKHKQ